MSSPTLGGVTREELESNLALIEHREDDSRMDIPVSNLRKWFGAIAARDVEIERLRADAVTHEGRLVLLQAADAEIERLRAVGFRQYNEIGAHEARVAQLEAALRKIEQHKHTDACGQSVMACLTNIAFEVL